MDETNFNRIANKFIENFAEFIESQYINLEVEIVENILYIANNKSQYVINKHVPTRQIWVSSPKTGAHHFYFMDQKQDWINTKDENITLNQLIKEELNDQ